MANESVKPLSKTVRNQKEKNKALKKQGKPMKTYNLLQTIDENERQYADGEQFSICKECGERFEQDYKAEINKYSDFKICHKCRRKKSANQGKKQEEKQISISSLKYTPYPWQEQFHKDMRTHRFAVLACGARCLTEKAFVNGCDKLVKDVCEEDIYIDKKGDNQKIISADSFSYNDYIYNLEASGILPIECTKEHGFHITTFEKDKDARKFKGRKLLSERFMTAEEIHKLDFEIKKHGIVQEHYVKIPRIKGIKNVNNWKCEKPNCNVLRPVNYLEINYDVAWLLGAYCADGCLLENSTSQITCNSEDTERLEKICSIIDGIGIYNSKTYDKDSKAVQVRFTKVQVGRLIADKVGRGSKNKRIPHDILYNSDERILIEFLKGYYRGDGYFNNKEEKLNFSTVSLTLAMDLQLAFARLGCSSNVSEYQRDRIRINKKGLEKKDSLIYNVNSQDSNLFDLLDISHVKNKKSPFSIVEDDFILVRLKNITREMKETTVYSISTEDETFCSNNILNHNSGKDRSCNMEFIYEWSQMLNENRHIDRPDLVPSILGWIVAPTEKMALQNWREFRNFFPKEWVVAISESTKTIETIGGGIIEVRSAYDPESLVGVGLDIVVVTESARVKDLEEVASNLEDRVNSPDRGIGGNGGRLIFNSSPIGKDHFYKMWTWGQESHPNYDSGWVSYQLPTTCNPSMAEKYAEMVKVKNGTHGRDKNGNYFPLTESLYVKNEDGVYTISEEGIYRLDEKERYVKIEKEVYITYEESLRRRKGRKFLQDNMAQFLDNGGTVFPSFREKCVYDIYVVKQKTNTRQEIKQMVKEWKEPKSAEQYRIGYDPASASSGDTPAVVVREMSTNHIVNVIDLYGISGDAQLDRVAYWSRYYNNAEVCVLSTGNVLIVGQLEGRGVNVIDTGEQGQKKRNYVLGLQNAVLNEDIIVLDDGSSEAETLIFQMEDYTESEKTGRFSNQDEEHDDFVSALYACYYDYNETPEVKAHYVGMMRGISR